ncbi:MAG TPA: SRPBCC family protein [Chthoniobacterales bacterium]|nr:SRPBCC family protein [Chthoniobacterales bacterium]
MASGTICLLAVALAVSAAGAETSKEEWKVAKQRSGVTIYSRPHNGSKLKEFKAVGEIDASSKTVHAVIDDVESYPDFMPYTAEARVLKRNPDSLITYQRISPKIVSDRDYTLRIDKKSWPAEFGIAYLNEWEPANESGPAEKPGVFRVKVVSGSWLLEPVAADKTRATYFVFTDSGIVVPQFLANTISETGILKLFAAVRKQAKEPKYQTQ